MQFGILGHDAPALSLNDWVNAKGETAAFEPKKGRVTILFFFQAWCPSCHSHGFPVLKDLMERYGDRVDFAAVQTVFEGFRENGPKRRAEMLDQYGIDLPVGQDEGQRPQTIVNYRTGGTPWFVVIDQNGRVAHNDYRLEGRAADRLLDGLLDGSKSAPEPEDDEIRVDGAIYHVDFAGGGSGHVETRKKGDTLYLMHSEVPVRFRGQGYGGRLMERFLEEVETRGLKVSPVCGYTAAYLRRYKRWAHLVA